MGKEPRRGNIDTAILNQFKKATGSFDAALQVFDNVVMPTLQKDIEFDDLLMFMLKEVNIMLHQRQSERRAIKGQLQEARDVLKDTAHEMKAVETYQQAKGYYEAADVLTIKRLVENFDQPALADAFVLVSEEELEKVNRALEQAKQRRLELE